MDIDDLKNRVELFRHGELDGQSKAMHMGTYYLVDDLWRQLQRCHDVLTQISKESCSCHGPAYYEGHNILPAYTCPSCRSKVLLNGD